MENKLVSIVNGVRDVDTGINLGLWKILLRDPDIFNETTLRLLRIWYNEPGHLATSKEMMGRYCPALTQSPYNGVVKAARVKINKKLQCSEFIHSDGKKCYYILFFKGYYENQKQGAHFVWEMRPELVQAIEELRLFEGGALDPSVDDGLTSVVYDVEGKRIAYYSPRYERSAKNREAAIHARGTVCEACGFDFEKAYGKLGHGFIEVHHAKPLYSLEGEEVPVNPKEDMVCVCANCHRMLHRRRDEILTVEQLRRCLASARKNQ